MCLDRVMHRRGNTLTYEKALQADGIEDSQDILVYWIKIDDKKYKGNKEEDPKKYDEIAVEELGRILVVDCIMDKEVQRKNLSKEGRGVYSIERGVILIVWWIKKQPIKMKVRMFSSQTRFKEDVSASINLTFKPLQWRNFTSISSQNLIKKQDLKGELKTLFEHSIESCLKEATGRVENASLGDVFQQRGKKTIRNTIKEHMKEEINNNPESYQFLKYYIPELEDIFWGDHCWKYLLH